MRYDNHMKKWVLYARTSTNRQEKGLEAQVRALKSFAEQRGITDFDIFSDEGISGAKTSSLMTFSHSTNRARVDLLTYQK